MFGANPIALHTHTFERQNNICCVYMFLKMANRMFSAEEAANILMDVDTEE